MPLRIGTSLLEIGSGITNWGWYYKPGRLLQIGAVQYSLEYIFELTVSEHKPVDLYYLFLGYFLLSPPRGSHLFHSVQYLNFLSKCDLIDTPSSLSFQP